VEFARELRLAGRSVMEAALEASRMRFRPIVMTSFAFILGVFPLVFATGAGAASRQSLGTAVCGGMITATVLAVFFVPIFYVAFQSLIEFLHGPPKLLPGEHAHGHAPPDHAPTAGATDEHSGVPTDPVPGLSHATPVGNGAVAEVAPTDAAPPEKPAPDKV
jgi:HAE1 family hydrophobic/amphiphilic exporter-1